MRPSPSIVEGLPYVLRPSLPTSQDPLYLVIHPKLHQVSGPTNPSVKSIIIIPDPINQSAINPIMLASNGVALSPEL
jgi:hypothetical protein